ncbi:MAG: hypothetical protein ACK4E8_11835 [Lacibacter sp.]
MKRIAALLMAGLGVAALMAFLPQQQPQPAGEPAPAVQTPTKWVVD